MGIDISANIVRIDKKLHAHIHEVMNIPFREYSKIMRSYRRKFNGRSHMMRDQVDSIIEIQMRYLNKYSALAPLAQRVHVECLNRYVTWLRRQSGYSPTFQPSWGKLITEYQDALAAYYLR